MYDGSWTSRRRPSAGHPAGGSPGIVISARERRSQKGNKFAFAMFSDTSGQFEAVIFSDTLNQCRDLLEAGTAVLLSVEGERDGDALKMRVQSLESLDSAVGSLDQGLRVVLDAAAVSGKKARLSDIKAHLKPGQNGRKGGEVRLVLPLGDQAREIEIVLPGRYDVSPNAAGRVSTVPGVVEVVENLTAAISRSTERHRLFMRCSRMLNGLGHVLLRGGLVGDDMSTEYRRVDGNPRSRIICFLPWCMPYRLAKTVGLVPCDYLACYEMPGAIVSSEPELCIRALRAVADDALLVLHRARLSPDEVLVVGLSIGNAVATYFANSIGAQLCSIASADRGDLTLWESPASRHIKQRAESKGYRLEDFTEAIRGYHSIDNLSNLASGSRFIIGTRDEFVPEPRRNGLIAAVRRELPQSEITFLEETHIGTMAAALKQGIASLEADKLRA